MERVVSPVGSQGLQKCELCRLPARIYCGADQASLCWNCDAYVHSANFLVMRHFRHLLCRNCHSPTRWTASGARLTPSFSICERCFGNNTKFERQVIDENQEIGVQSDGCKVEEDDNMRNTLGVQFSPMTSKSSKLGVSRNELIHAQTMTLKRNLLFKDICSLDPFDSSSATELPAGDAGDEEVMSLGLRRKAELVTRSIQRDSTRKKSRPQLPLRKHLLSESSSAEDDDSITTVTSVSSSEGTECADRVKQSRYK